MAFVGAAAGWFWAQMWARQAQGRPPKHKLPRGNVPHPCYIRPASQGPWGRVCGTGPSPCHPEDHPFSREPHFSAGLPSRKGRVPREELGTRGLHGGRPRFRARWSGPGRAGPTPTDGFSCGESGLRSAWAAKSLALAETSSPVPKAANLTEGLPVSKVCDKPPIKAV